jgi:hypothetical protein
MEAKRLTKKLKNLKVGDTVVIYENYSNRTLPHETVIEKVGKKFVYTKNGYINKFSIENGHGECGMVMYPGTLEEYNDSIENNKLAQEAKKLFDKECNYLTKSELLEIINILKDE